MPALFSDVSWGVNAYLDANRLRAGDKIALRLADVRLDTLLDQRIADLSSLHERDIILRNSAGAVHGLFDEDGVGRVIYNLVSNAVKYGDKGTPITVSLSQGCGRAQVRVHNEGEPIAAEDRENLFKQHFRTKSAQRSDQQGWGLGLAVVKELVELHDGHIHVESSRNCGTARGIDVTYETVRRWAAKFGQTFARQIRGAGTARGEKWHLDEMVIKMRGRVHWLWRAVDQHGAVLDALVQSRRDRHAAVRLMRKLLKSQGCAPRVLVTDKLRSYAAANDMLGLTLEHRQHKGLNNRAENSHQPTRVREKVMRRFKSPRQIQRFTAIHDAIANLFMYCRYNPNAAAKRQARVRAHDAWEVACGTKMFAGLVLNAA